MQWEYVCLPYVKISNYYEYGTETFLSGKQNAMKMEYINGLLHSTFWILEN